MPDVFVARQPIFDSSLDLSGYELLFRGANVEEALVSDNDGATSTVIINAFTELGLERVVGDRRAWLNVSRSFILNDLILTLPADRVVLEVLEEQEVDEQLLAALAALRAEGYLVALDDFVYSPAVEPLLAHADIIKVDVMANDREALALAAARLRRQTNRITLLAEKVETQDDFDYCAALGFDLFQGYFFCKPQLLSDRSAAPNRLAVMQLAAALQDPQIQLDEIELLISRDVALSYRLLRYINSAFFGLRREVASIGRAVALLGIENVRRWSTMTIFAGIDDKPRQLIETALVRARFCELAAKLVGFDSPEQLFTLGLFSVVDALMDAPMKEVLASVPFPDDMLAALIDRTGPKGRLLSDAVALERGEPVATGSGPELEAAYFDALAWATDAAAALFPTAAAAA